ncbi:MAG: radical SAM protein [Nitrospirota bacterium]|nr:radical SAM protein [Nitrospirota bacterium]
MSKLTAILVHGFTGSSSDLDPLAIRLESIMGKEGIRQIILPTNGGGGDNVCFDRDTLVEEVAGVFRELQADGRPMVLVGHSTGGNIALEALAQSRSTPELVVLAATPCVIDLSYLDRWRRHSENGVQVSLASVAGLVSLINSTANAPVRSFPVLILQGDGDELVPPSEVEQWAERFIGKTRIVIVSGGGHHLFADPASVAAVDEVVREISILQSHRQYSIDLFAERFQEVEPEARRFLAKSSGLAHHLASSPSGRRLMEMEPLLPPEVDWGPVFANIEITTRCNLSCRYCARVGMKRHDMDMAKEKFADILERLPHAYRVTLVGLGEPLLHPRVTTLVAHASGKGRRTALVTNGMFLSEELGAELLDAGLDSIAFSIDAATQASAGQLRRGSDISRITKNISDFARLAKQAGRPVSTAVFSAVSKESVRGLPQLVDLVASLGVDVLMLTDLNYPQNQPESLNSTINPDIARLIRKAVKSAFSRNLPVLTVRGLEEFGLASRWRENMLLPPDHLYRRSAKHRFCCSPWQTVAVDVDGTATLCDCQPDKPVGNLFEVPLEEIWNGEVMREHRRRMVGDEPPEACRGCPRF